MYALNINPDDGRVLSATFERYAAPGQPIVVTLPDGNITDYRYENGEYIYDPIPEPVVYVAADRNYDKGDLFRLDDVLYEALSALPRGVRLYVGRNVAVTSVEEQIAKLKGEQ